MYADIGRIMGFNENYNPLSGRKIKEILVIILSLLAYVNKTIIFNNLCLPGMHKIRIREV